MPDPLKFCKYHGTGNDFILIDNRAGDIALSRQMIAHLCHRRFGIGADGLMLLETEAGADFRMVYYNSDGGESSMCGNGGRCITAFAKRLGIISTAAVFSAVDGLHIAQIFEDDTVSLAMADVTDIRMNAGYAILDTGSPHFVLWVEDVEHTPVADEGKLIRNESRFAPGGTNVNFAQRLTAGSLRVRTYERGVEGETMSCGTGVTAAAIASAGSETGDFRISVETPGGSLRIDFSKTTAGTAEKIILSGPAVFVYEGTVSGI